MAGCAPACLMVFVNQFLHDPVNCDGSGLFRLGIFNADRLVTDLQSTTLVDIITKSFRAVSSPNFFTLPASYYVPRGAFWSTVEHIHASFKCLCIFLRRSPGPFMLLVKTLCLITYHPNRRRSLPGGCVPAPHPLSTDSVAASCFLLPVHWYAAVAVLFFAHGAERQKQHRTKQRRPAIQVIPLFANADAEFHVFSCWFIFDTWLPSSLKSLHVCCWAGCL